MSDLAKLAKPFPASYIQKKGDRGDEYVGHSIVNQALLAVVGPFDFEAVREIYDEGILTGVVARLTVTIDGRLTKIEEAGDVENPKSKPTNGARLKDAMSDAFKRCCMRPGLGLHLWAQQHYFLHASLIAKEAENGEPDGTE